MSKSVKQVWMGWRACLSVVFSFSRFQIAVLGVGLAVGQVGWGIWGDLRALRIEQRVLQTQHQVQIQGLRQDLLAVVHTLHAMQRGMVGMALREEGTSDAR